MHLDSNLLLTAENLRLDPGLTRGRNVKGTLAIKQLASQTYLTVSAAQLRVLDEFAQQKTVPEALEGCIRDRTCTPLREFYDLILKAHRAGILRSEELANEGAAPITRPSVRWFVSLRPEILLPVIVLGALAAMIGLGLRLPLLPATGIDFLIGWLAICGALSLGQALAASALRGAGCEVHRPYFRWLTAAPHFAVDLRDARMAGLPGRAAVLAAALFPLLLTAAAAVWLHQSWSVFPLFALALLCLPVGSSPVAGLLRLLRREPLLDTDSAPLFDARPSLAEKWRIARRRFDPRVAGLQFGLGIAWALALGRVGYGVLDLPLWRVLQAWTGWEKFLLGFAGTLGAVVLLWTAGQVQYYVLDAVIAA